MAYVSKPASLSLVWATTGLKEKPVDSKIAQGWISELPPFEFQNWLQNRADAFQAHVNQNGIPEWDNTTEYQGGKSFVRGSDGKLYKALLTHLDKNPVDPTNSAYWTEPFDVAGSAAAVNTALQTHITNYGTLAGLSSTATARTNLSVWSKAESDARYAARAGDAAQTFSVGEATAADHAVRKSQLDAVLSAASTTVVGILRLATSSEVELGTSTDTAVSPATGQAIYLKKSGNLAGLTNLVAARTNLGLGGAAVRADSFFLQAANNLSDVSNVVAARTNLGLGGAAIRADSFFLQSGNNFSDLTNVVAARTNLGLSAAATAPFGTTADTVAQGNDSRIVNAVQTSRQIVAGNGLTGGGTLAADRTVTLGTPGTITGSSANAVTATSHTHDLDVASFLGTAAGTAAAGNDSRIVNAVQTSRSVVAGNGLVGGGTLAADRTVTLGTPSTLTQSTANAVTATSHTHQIDLSSFFSDRSLTANGYQVFPGGFCLQWGTTGMIGGSNQVLTTNFNRAFTTCLFVQVGTVSDKTTSPLSQRKAELIDFTNNSFRWGSDTLEDSGSSAIGCTWVAIGLVS